MKNNKIDFLIVDLFFIKLNHKNTILDA